MIKVVIYAVVVWSLFALHTCSLLGGSAKLGLTWPFYTALLVHTSPTQSVNRLQCCKSLLHRLSQDFCYGCADVRVV